MALTAQQKQVVLDYVRSRIAESDKLPTYRAEFVTFYENGKSVKVALPENEVVGEITVNGQTLAVRTDSSGKIVYGTRVRLKGRRRRLPLPPEQVAQFIDAFGDLLRRIEA